jgi:hypothetical protein
MNDEKEMLTNLRRGVDNKANLLVKTRHLILLGETHASLPGGEDLLALESLWKHFPIRLGEGWQPEKLLLGKHYQRVVEERQLEFRERYGLLSSSAITSSVEAFRKEVNSSTLLNNRKTENLGQVLYRFFACKSLR